MKFLPDVSLITAVRTFSGKDKVEVISKELTTLRRRNSSKFSATSPTFAWTNEIYTVKKNGE